MKLVVLHTIADIEANADVVAAVYSHVTVNPPYGPFMHLSAVELSMKLKESINVEASPSLLTALFMRNWDVDQWRQWSALYVPLDILPSAVEQL